jgi:hypothetical protein
LVLEREAVSRDDALAEGCQLVLTQERKERNVPEMQDLWIRKENAEGDEADMVVYVKVSGVWYEAIRERMDVTLSHYSSVEEDLRLFRDLGFLMSVRKEVEAVISKLIREG